jgi:tetratricopeptide (TPR) repeat protein
MRESKLYCRRSLELRAAEYYASIRKPECEWKSIEDLAAEFEHRVEAEDYDRANQVLNLIDTGYLSLWGHHALLAKRYEVLVERLTDPKQELKNSDKLARHYRNLGRITEAIQIYNTALPLAHKIKEDNTIGVLLGGLGSAYRDLGQVERAVEYYQQALKIARQVHDDISEAVQLNRLGYAYHFLGKFEQALEFQRSALAINIKLSNLEGMEVCRIGLGVIHQCLGNLEQARCFYKEALEIAQQIGHSWGEMASLGYLGNVFSALGQTDRAIGYYERGLWLAREFGHRREESLDLSRLGQAFLVINQPTKAQQYCKNALNLDYPNANWRAMLLLGIVHLHREALDAPETFTRAAMRCRAIRDKTPNLYEPLYGLATALVGQAVCDPNWADPTQRNDLLAPALAEYRRALDITSASGVVRDAIRDLELIRAAGIERLEPVFELLEGALDEQP